MTHPENWLITETFPAQFSNHATYLSHFLTPSSFWPYLLLLIKEKPFLPNFEKPVGPKVGAFSLLQ